MQILCGQCSKKDPVFRCSACKTVRYCSQICQKSHWKLHKKQCKKIRNKLNNDAKINTNKPVSTKKKKKKSKRGITINVFEQFCDSKGIYFKINTEMKSIPIQNINSTSTCIIGLTPTNSSGFENLYQQRIEIITNNLLYQITNDIDMERIKVLTLKYIKDIMENPNKKFNLVELPKSFAKSEYKADYGWVTNGVHLNKSFSNNFAVAQFVSFGLFSGTFIIYLLLYNSDLVQDFDKFIKIKKQIPIIKFK